MVSREGRAAAARPSTRDCQQGELQAQNLAQLGGARIGHDRPTDVESWHRAIAAIPLFDALGCRLIVINVNFRIGDLMFFQEPLGDAAIASPRGRIHRDSRGHISSCAGLWDLWSACRGCGAVAQRPGELIQTGQGNIVITYGAGFITASNGEVFLEIQHHKTR